MKMLLANPPVKAKAETVAPRRTSELLMEATRAFARWTQTGFKRVDEKTYARRLQAYQVCEYFAATPDRLIYHFAPGVTGERNICSLCGCAVAAKARMASESCPAPDPLHPDLSR
jgi:hypothetical protein